MQINKGILGESWQDSTKHDTNILTSIPTIVSIHIKIVSNDMLC
jgi:hypothetical protein